MAFQEISTGYKPEFTLGGLYHGYNAANAEEIDKQEMIKAYLANQREQQMQPLDVNIRGMESDRATQARSPDMLQAYKDLYLAQRDQTKASGDKARETSSLDIATALQELKHKQQMGHWQSQLDEIKNGTIGFPMQSQQAQENLPGTIGFPAPNRPADGSSRSGSSAWIIPQQVQNTNDNAAGILNARGRSDPSYDLAELNRALASKGLGAEQRAALMGEHDRLTRGLSSTPQSPNVNDSPVVQQAPLRNGGLNQGSPEYERLMQNLVDQPELRAKLIPIDQKLDSDEFKNERRIQAKFEELALKAKSVAAKLPTMEQQMVQNILDRKAAGIISPAEATGEINAWLNRKYDKPLQQGVTAQVGEKGIEIVDKEKQTPIVRSKTGATSNRDALKEALSK